MNKTLVLNKSNFGADFEWGVATAAFQIEGAHHADGKGVSIWDEFTAKKGRIRGSHNATVSCDFYNYYKDDIRLIRALNIPNFRFSLSWTRLMPSGKPPFNQAGIDYYNKVIDFLLECGITPWITLYHWDLPQELEIKGGWTNRDSVSWFSDYVALCAKKFGDRVTNWMVMNEPSVFTGAGYFLGIHAPGKRGITNYLKAVHNVTRATAEGGRILRNTSTAFNIGTTFSCTHTTPNSSRIADQKANSRVDTLLNRTFIEPILGMGYPKTDLPLLERLDQYIIGNDENELAFDFDFIGIQCYTREVVKASLFTPYIGASLVKPTKRKVITTAMNWEVHPESIYHMIAKFNGYSGIRKLIITENGAAFPDVVVDGQVHDFKRTAYIQDHLEQVLKAKNEGLQVDGYFVWSLTDNFEWAEGYHPRFGLIYVDFDTQERIIKQSGHWFRDFLGNR